MEDNADIKKAIAKNLFYLNFAAVFSFVYNIVPASFPFIRNALADRGLLSLILTHYGLRVFLNLPSVITPIAAMIILKPISLALKQGMKKCVCKRNED